MNRLLTVCLLVASTSAFAQPRPDAGSPPPDAGAPAGVLTQAPGSPEVGARVEREQMRREVLEEVHRALEKQKEEVRDEVRAQIATQTANRSLEEEFQVHEARRRLELFEVDGYLRMRPELFYNFAMGRGTDPRGFSLFPPPPLGGKTLADANMRWRIEPTLNVSEDVRIRSQIDVFDNLILGATPTGAFGISERTAFPIGSNTQEVPAAGMNWLNNSIQVRRVYGEVTTPVGQFLFGRMGSQWGLGMLTNSGNCLDCDFGDTVDRVMFVSTPIANHFVVPFIDFVSEGPTSIRPNELFGQPFDREQLDDARDYGIAIARRDTDVEINRKLAAGRDILNYGLYFVYRTQRWDPATFDRNTSPYGDAETDPKFFGYVLRDAHIYVPDVWVKYQTKRFRLELEVAGVFGKIGSVAIDTTPTTESQAITLSQVGAVVQGQYKLLDKLDLSLEFGFASGDRAPGMGNLPGRTSTAPGQLPAAANLPGTVPGSIDGPQYCVAADCAVRDTKVTNFRFSRDYRVDLILWREIFDGITDAIYIKPGGRYRVTEGLDLWANVIYSRAVYGSSTPSSHQSGNEVVGNANLGFEIDTGVTYESGDGFLVGAAYGVLFPLAGLNNLGLEPLNAGTAQTVRGWFAIKY